MAIAFPRVDDVVRTGFRAGSTNATVLKNLGLLAELPGEWRGSGFNVTARPFFGNEPPFFLELNATDETLDFTAIGGDIPNRGSLQPDIELHGIRYVQHVIDKKTETGIHVEPGLWLHVPPTTSPVESETYVRQSTIPHGDSLVAQSTFTTTVNGGPLIDPVDTRPFTDATIPSLNATATQIVSKPGYLDQYNAGTLPDGLPSGLTYKETVQDPTLVLKAQIADQKIMNTVVIAISTAIPDPSNPKNIFNHLVNIPFVNKNAKATQLDAIFWIEIVEQPNGSTFVQLQYVQRVILDFIGIHWPHISVATLKRF
jgi:hypothetical protein